MPVFYRKAINFKKDLLLSLYSPIIIIIIEIVQGNL